MGNGMYQRAVEEKETGRFIGWFHFRPFADAPEEIEIKAAQEELSRFYVSSLSHRLISYKAFLVATALPKFYLDLQNKDLKRSVHPVHYVFMFHSLVSSHMADHDDSLDHYDTILCAGPHHEREIRKRESMLGLPAKRLLPTAPIRTKIRRMPTPLRPPPSAPCPVPRAS